MEDKFLQYFEQLKSAQKDVVIKTTEKINQAIKLEKQPEKQEGKQGLKVDNKFGQNLNEQFKYALKRLTNGIISTNPQVQLNYSFCLSQIFKTYKSNLNIKEIIQNVNEKSSKQMAVNKTEINMFAIGRTYILKAVAKSSIIESKQEADSILEFVYEILFNDFQQYEFLQENILEVMKIFLSNKQNFKQKLKLAINKGKFLLQEHNCISIQYLAIIYLACEKTGSNFSYAQNLQDKVFNHKNLLKALQNEIQNFPKKSASYSYIIQYIKSVSKNTPERINEIWAEFFKFLLKECSHDHKSYYVILNIFYQFLKQAQIEDLKYVLIMDLVHMWLKNLSVMNQVLKKISLKIDSKLIKLINNSQVDKKLNDSQQKQLLEFIKIMKQESTYSFTPKSRVAQVLLSSLSIESVQEYYKFLKHQLHKTVDPTDRKYYLNEIYIIADILTGKIPEALFFEICFLLFEQANQSKLKLVFSKIPADIKEDFEEQSFINSNREIILGYFYSLLSSTFRVPSKNFQNKKGFVWRGISQSNESMLLLIAKDIIQKQDHFRENEELHKIISDLKPYLQKIENQQKEIQQQLKNETDENQKQETKQTNEQKQQQKQQNKNTFNLKMQIGFLNLFVGIIIQSLIFAEEGVNQLEEVDLLYKEIVKYFEKKEKGEKTKKKRKLNNSSSKDSDLTSQEPTFINVLVDLLISLLTRSASYLRDVINICFANFQEHLDLMSIETLTNVIIRDNDEYINEMEQQGESDIEMSEDEYETEDEEIVEE